MCSCGCSKPAPPSGGPVGPVAACPHAASAILIVDELGLPLANQSVTLHVGATTHSMKTDASGVVCLTLPPGTKGKVEVANVHEAQLGDSTTTPSGRHFKTSGTGP